MSAAISALQAEMFALEREDDGIRGDVEAGRRDVARAKKALEVQEAGLKRAIDRSIAHGDKKRSIKSAIRTLETQE